MRNTLFILLVLGVVGIGRTQQAYQFIGTNLNPFTINPAAGGLYQLGQFESSSRMQWSGYEGAPKTFMFSGHSPIAMGKFKKHKIQEFNVDQEQFYQSPEVGLGSKHVLGGMFYSDIIGPFTKTAFHGSYAHHLALTKKLNAGVGLGLGYSNFRLNDAKVRLGQTDDAAYTTFLSSSTNQSILDASLGVVIYNNNLFIGFSSSQLLNNAVNFNGVTTESRLQTTHYVIAKYKHSLNFNYQIEPVVSMMTSKNNGLHYSIGARVIHKGFAWAGLHGTNQKGLAFQVGSNLFKSFYANYAYQLFLGPIHVPGNGTHEIQLGYYLGKKRNIEKELKESEKEASPKQ